MSYEKNITVKKSSSESYQAVLALLENEGFKIERRRDMANLVQASREVEAGTYLFNITCGMGLETKITMGCISSPTGDGDEGAMPIIEDFLKALEGQLA